VRLTFFRSGARGLHVPAKLPGESAKHEARKRRANKRPRVACCEELARRRFPAALWLRNREFPTDLARKMIWNLLVSWYGFDMARKGIAPELMLFPLAFEETAVPT